MMRKVLKQFTRHYKPYVYHNMRNFTVTKQGKETGSYETTSGARHSYWIDFAPPRPKTTQLDSDVSVDTCVIGAGIAGLSTAYLLAQQGQKVAVLESGEIASGESGRTTGYLTWVIDDGIQNISKLFGRDGATLHVDSHRTAVDMVENIVKAEGIQCEFKRLPTYWFSRKPKNEQKGQPDEEIMKEYNAMLDIGMTGVQIVDKPPWAKDDGKCLKIDRQGQFHPVAYLLGMTRAIQSAGSSVYTSSKVVDWKGGKNPWVKTENGFKVQCSNLVMATNIPLQLVTTIGKMENFRTYVVAGELPKGKYEWFVFQDDSMIHHNPYKYGRFTSVNDKTDLLLVGGEDHQVGFKDDFNERYQHLEKWTLDRFPDIKFTYRWSGQIQEPSDLMAYIGLNPGEDHMYIITGDSGLGLTHGTLGAKLVSDMILGIPNPWKDLYDPKRLEVMSFPEAAKHFIQINLQYKDYFKGGTVDDIDQIEPDNGAIICKGINHYAVYKDKDGKITACSAVCPHLKGRVRWNSSEKSWDCPVHGSRFDKFGTTIQGPAKSNLKKVEVEQVLKK